MVLKLKLHPSFEFVCLEKKSILINLLLISQANLTDVWLKYDYKELVRKLFSVTIAV